MDAPEEQHPRLISAPDTQRHICLHTYEQASPAHMKANLWPPDKHKGHMRLYTHEQAFSAHTKDSISSILLLFTLNRKHYKVLFK